MSQLHEFIRRNIGQTLTPELAMGMSWAVDTLMSEMYQEALKVAQEEARAEERRRTASKGLVEDDWPERGHFKEYSFTREAMSILRDLRAIHEAHFNTTERPRAPSSELTVDYNYYEEMAAAKRMVLFVVRDWQGKPVGNMILRVGRSQISGELAAEEEVLFIAEEHRKGMMACAFVRWCLAQLKRWGVARVTVATKETNDVGVFYRRLGFTPMAHVYGKEL